MENNWFNFDRDKQQISVKVNGKVLVIDKNNTDISYFSGGPGGQNVNRNLKGVQLIFRIPIEYRRPNQKTQQLVTRVVGKRSLHQNTEMAFQQLAGKIHHYFYIPPIRKCTKVPRKLKEERLRSKKMQAMKKQSRKSVDF